MKNLAPFVVLLLAVSGTAAFAQEETQEFETFEYTEGDTTFLMKKYFMCFLKSGPVRSQNEEEAQALQTKHLAHINKLAEEKKVCMAGPFGDDGEIRGILIFNTPTLEEAERLAKSDPSVQAGRLVVEIHPWWAAVGSTLF